ncbi:MAG: hypothetical protein KF687_03040 [Cyclobacteriaceae bacterium]|nr:hypothetical protein [Cyclobacteriaceae bacterium]
MSVNKKRIIKSLENLSEDLNELLRRQYPGGYESSITRIMNAKKEPIFVFPLETDDAIYLVKVPATKNSDGGYDVESGEAQEFDSAGDGDDDYGTNDDFESGGDDEFSDDEGGGKRSQEASYDPDFDN